MYDVQIGDLTVSNDRPLLVIAGPCQLESLDHAQMIAGQMAENCKAAGAQFVFKGSFDKANRTSLTGKRGLGIDAGLKVMQAVKEATGCPVLTDIHSADQCADVAAVCDIMQIRVSVPSNRSADCSGRNWCRDQCQKGSVFGALGHAQCCVQDRKHWK